MKFTLAPIFALFVLGVAATAAPEANADGALVERAPIAEPVAVADIEKREAEAEADYKPNCKPIYKTTTVYKYKYATTTEYKYKYKTTTEYKYKPTTIYKYKYKTTTEYKYKPTTVYKYKYKTTTEYKYKPTTVYKYKPTTVYKCPPKYGKGY
jgi:alkylated DNA repair dioxygenase AlkB